MRFAILADRLAALPATLPAPAATVIPTLTGAAAGTRPTFPAQTASSRPAAVLVLLFPDESGDARVVLTERVTRDGHHSGEVSFPGGRAEPGDADLAATALREAAEEVALDPVAAGVRVIGQLERFWIPVSNYEVTPVLALAERPPGARRVAGRGGPHHRARGRLLPAGRPDRDRRGDHSWLAAPLRRLPG